MKGDSILFTIQMTNFIKYKKKYALVSSIETAIT